VEFLEKARMAKQQCKENVSVEPIYPERLYPLKAFEQAAGVGKAGLSAARQNGLAVRYAAGRGWILGSDWIQYVIKNGKLKKDG
jgi:hypothetical protein